MAGRQELARQCNNSEHNVEIYRSLRVLLECQDTSQNAFCQLILEMDQAGLHDYYVNAYKKRAAGWTPRFYKGIGISTNMNLRLSVYLYTSQKAAQCLLLF